VPGARPGELAGEGVALGLDAVFVTLPDCDLVLAADLARAFFGAFFETAVEVFSKPFFEPLATRPPIRLFWTILPDFLVFFLSMRLPFVAFAGLIRLTGNIVNVTAPRCACL
jgi:hypothetical protein